MKRSKSFQKQNRKWLKRLNKQTWTHVMRFVLLCLRATASGENFKTLLPLPSPPSKHYFRSLLTCAGSLFVFRVRCGRAAPGAGSQLSAGRYLRWMLVRCGADEMQLRGGLTVTASPYCCFFMTEDWSQMNHRKHDSSFFYKWDHRRLPHGVWEWFGRVRAFMSPQLKLHGVFYLGEFISTHWDLFYWDLLLEGEWHHLPGASVDVCLSW